MKILIVEDDKDISNDVFAYLTKEQYICEQSFCCAEAYDKINLYEYDCIILDLMLPDGNGLDVLRELSNNCSNTGVIILSAKDSLEDKIEGLEIGADDYLPKPFHLSELKIRIHAISRRRKNQYNNRIISNGIEVDMLNITAKVDGNTLLLTRSEWNILYYFVSNKERVVSKKALAEYLSGDMTDCMDNFNFVYTHVKNLKLKLKDSGVKDCIKNIYGLGYKWVEL